MKKFILAVLALQLVACASPSGGDAHDPLESMNRRIDGFNQSLDKAVLRPIAKGYLDYVPAFARDRIHDLLSTWSEPIDSVNLLLQGRPGHAAQSVSRFAFNATLGVGGLVDVSSAAGIPNHDTSFGTTFAVWGIGDGPYLVLPFFGPSNGRDAVGRVVGYFADSAYDDELGLNGSQELGVWGSEVIEGRAALIGPDKMIYQQIDPYAALRDGYQQRRAAEIREAKGLAPATSNSVDDDLDALLDDL